MKQHTTPQLFGLLLAGFCLLASGCATITRGTKDTLVVESEPAGATVKLSNGMSGKTPTSFTLPRKESLVVTIEKEGYETLTVNVNPQVVGAGAAGMAGNIVFGGLVGVVVDPLSGAMKDLKPNPVKAVLVASRKTENAVPAAVAVAAPVAAPAAPAPSASAVAPAPAATSADATPAAVAPAPTPASTGTSAAAPVAAPKPQ
jgi:hypothetical protein